MKLTIIPWWNFRQSICICGYNFGYWGPGAGFHGGRSFLEVKREHFEERHPRRLAQGGII